MAELSDLTAKFVGRKIKTLFSSKADLALLRRGVGKKIGEIPEILGYVYLPIDEDNKYTDLAANAIYTALTLYAFHQQGNIKFMGGSDEQDESVHHKSFGYAVKQLCTEDTKIAVTRRFDKVLTAKDLSELAVHARALIGQLRQKSISFDYGQFAKDLYWFQQEDYKRNVVLKWGKDFYKMERMEKEND
jgi:CRISPR system Cascade subunit CasB